MNFQKLNTLHHICEFWRTQLISTLAVSVQSPQLAGYLLTGNRSNFLHEEGSIACSNDCHQLLSTLCEADKCFACILIYYQDTMTYIDPITGQLFDLAIPTTCVNNPQIVIALGFDIDEDCALIPEPVL